MCDETGKTIMIAKTVMALLALTPFALTQGKPDADYIKNTLYPATVLLYSQSESGGMNMRCTATAIERNSDGYVFVIASHCACDDNVDKHTVSPEKTFFFITPDNAGGKNFLRAKPIGCGYKHRGDDYALFEVETTESFPVIPLGKDPQLLDQVVNVASPLGLGKQVFFGTVSTPILNRPVISGDINWTDAVLLQMFGVAGGSSGSALLCLSQRAICGFVVGSVAETTMVTMPVSRLVKMRSELAAGRYRYWKHDLDAPPTSSE
jgi:S1-C subfamily serine protease